MSLPMLTRIALVSLAAVIGWSMPPVSGPSQNDTLLSAETLSGLKLRGIGPALTSGRIGDFAVNLEDPARYYVAVCSGGVWKTVNGGTTFTPVFDTQGSYSIGCVEMDPRNPHVVWVGTGENNSQRSVSFGDGVYRSRDGGKNWENLGLKESEHIGMILIDPRDSDTVYVAAQGPLWRSGGDRGLYKTTDGGQTWKRILHVDDDTGANEIHCDPRDSNVLYATTYQRRRHVWTLINGGPGSAFYKSTDAGKTWRKITSGLPEVDLGRIGIDVCPTNPDIVYAIVEAAQDKGGFFRSTDRGETWEKRSDYQTSSAQYYNEILCHPDDPDMVYVLDTFTKVTRDGGKTFERLPREHRHVDDHALWINPDDPDHMIIGGDGGVYDTYDGAANWRFMPNLPVTQFYRGAVDNSEPFYFVYGGTQDNNTLGGPSRTISPAGITNEDWFVTVGGDGFKTQVDPEDPNIVYSQWQHGGLVRFDRRSGQRVDIKPREAPDEQPNRWNWDSPLLISPHNHQRLYFAAQKVYRSDDQGNSWTVISDDLTRQLDRDQLPIMGRIWSVDAVARHDSTSYYGNIVALAESPLVEGLLYAGTDDGLIQVTEDGGETWRKIDVVPGVPPMTYVSRLLPSLHDADTVYAAFDNHKQGDFRPYVQVSLDRGRTWHSIAGDLPGRHFVYDIEEDHELPSLLFVGTEFGLHFTADGGGHWTQLKGGIPTIAVRDVELQRRENDVVCATFGRGFYILDDYSPLRQLSEEFLQQDSVLFPVKDALAYIETSRLGGRSGRGSQGASYFAAPNPPFGATFTYYLKEKLQSNRERRHEAEKEARENERPIAIPTLDELRAEDLEPEPSVVLVVRDEEGGVVRRITAPREKGIRRVAWDLRYPSSTPVDLTPDEDRAPWDRPPTGPLAAPGTYTVTLNKMVDEQMTPISDQESFEVIPLHLATFAADDRAEVLAFQKKVARLQRAVRGAIKASEETESRLAHIRRAILETPAAQPELLAETRELQLRLNDLLIELRGDPILSKLNRPQSPSINGRVQAVVGNQWRTTSAPTHTQQDAYTQAGEQFGEVLGKLHTLIERDLPELDDKLEEAGAPYTPGRLPQWEME